MKTIHLFKNRIMIILFLNFFIFSAKSQVVKLDINGNFTIQGNNSLYWKYRYKATGSNDETYSALIYSANISTIKLNPFISWDFSRNFHSIFAQAGAWEDYFTINSDYAAISKSVGYSFNFNTSAIAEGWRGYRLQNTTENSNSNIVETNALANGSTGKSVYMGWYYNYGLILVSPKLNDLAADKKFSIYANGFQGNYPLVLGTITDPYDPTTFHPLKTVILTGGTFNKIEVFLNNYNGQDKYIAIKNMGATGDIYLDDFSYDQSVNCYDNTDLSVSNVSEDKAIVNFNADTTQTNWELHLKDITRDITQTINISTNKNYILENLVGNTNYEVKVRANCAPGLYSNWTPVQTFRTSCSTISSGYKTSFLETPFFNPCWTKLESGASIIQAPLIGHTLKPRTGSRYISMVNTVTSSTQKSFIVTPYITDLDNKKRIKFFLISDVNGSAYNKNSLTIGTMSNPEDASTFIALKTILPSEMNEINGYKTNDYWKEHIVYLDNYNVTNNHHYIAIKQNNLDSNSSRFNIDDFTYESIPACKEPVNLKLIKSDFESAKISWENNNTPNNEEWEIQYGVSGFAIGNGKTVSSTSTVSTISNLSSFTNYDFYVRNKCGTTYSNWSDRGVFKTKCTGVTTGYAYDFENDSFNLNTCWSRTTPDIRDRFYSPDTFINYITPPYGGSSTAHSGTKLIMINGFKNSPDALVNEKSILVTPRLLDLNNERKISFWAYVPSNSYSKLTSIQIGTLSDPEDYSTFVPYESITSGFAINQWKNYSIDFSNYYGTNKFIGIRMFNNNTSNYLLFIDDFIYTDNQCSRPSSLTAAQNGVSSATLNWKTNNNNPINCEIEYGPIGFTPGAGTLLTTTSLPVEIPNLNLNTKYQYRVRNICTTNIVNWSNLYEFKISCTINAPFTENFDQYPASNGSLIPNFCWSTNENSNENIYAGVGRYHLTNFNSSPNSGYFYNSNDTNKPTYFISPYLDDFGNTKRVKFWINKNNSSSAQVVTIGTLSNPLDFKTFSPYQILDTSNMPAYGKEINVDFTNYVGTNKHVAFKLAGSDFSNTYIDDFRYLDQNNCIEPINIQFLNISSNSALVKWENTNGENVAIEYGVTGFTLGTGLTVNSNLNEILISNLQSTTKYDFYFKTTCKSGESIVVGQKNFTTTCDNKQLPWIENFNNLAQYGNNLLPPCFSRLAGGTITSYNSPLLLNTNFYENDHVLSGNSDNTYLWINSFTGPSGYSGVISPTFNLKAGTTYKFSLDARKSYEYDSQSLRMYAGRGNMMHYMETELSRIGILSEYRYNSNSFVFTPIISGDYSFILQARASGTTNMILDNFELKEAHTNIITNNSDIFDFQNGTNTKLILESTQNSLTTIQSDVNNITNKLLKMAGSNSSSDSWMSNQTNTWISNQNNITKVNMKINASGMTSLFMSFDLKQTFNESSDESMFRVVVNGNVIGDVLKPNSMNLDPMRTLQYDLTPYVSGFISISLQHIGKSTFNIGDHAYLDNVKFNQTSLLSIDENNFIGLKYYPNPVSNILNIENNNIIGNIEIISVTGQSIFKQNNNTNKVSIDTKKLSNGIYFVKITSENKTKVIKIIVSS